MTCPGIRTIALTHLSMFLMLILLSISLVSASESESSALRREKSRSFLEEMRELCLLYVDGTKLITRRNSLLLSDDGRKFVIIAPVHHIVVLVELRSEGHHARGLEEG